MWVFPFVILSALATLFSLVSSCIISIGFAVWCGMLGEVLPAYSCRQCQTQVKFYDKDDHSRAYDGSSFFDMYTVGQVSYYG